MASARFGIEIDVTAIDASLAKIESAVKRGTALKRGMKEAMQPIAAAARINAPQPGSSGYTPRAGARKSRKMLHRTIGIAVRHYEDAIVGIVGPEYPAGATGHLVEFGHRLVRGGSVARSAESKWSKKGTPSSKRGRQGQGRVVGRVEGRPFMRPAFDAHAAGVMPRLIAAINEAIEEGAK